MNFVESISTVLTATSLTRSWIPVLKPIGMNWAKTGRLTSRGAAKGFVRAYAFLVQILPHKNIEWEKLSIFLNYLIPKLPAPIEEDMSKGILEVIDMESYRVEKQTAQKIMLDDGDAEIDPASASGGGYLPETDMTLLSVILNEFNNRFGTEFTDADQVGELIVKIPELVKANDAYHNVPAGKYRPR